MLCRLSQALISSPFEVPAEKLRNVTLTLHKVHTARALCRSVCGGTHGTHGDHWRSPGTQPCPSLDPCSLGSLWQHRGRGATLAATCVFPTPLSCSRHGRHVTKDRLVVAHACLPALLLGHSSRIMQTRAASTATKRREISEQHSDTDKGEEQTQRGDPSPLEKDSGKPEAPPEEEKPNKTQQLKKVFKEYGAVGVSFHISISLMSLGMFYLLVSSGIDMGALLCKLGFSETVVKSKMAAGTSTFVLAYAVHKLFAPVRMSITLVSVPLIVRHFRKIGLFKTPPTAP
ncbi:unnamed protein product [Knipowitschia caucasica]|uniref:DUF1279 domain-containing protein n=1 Tax=Knipowitschia caucasica TaxID=637954 RepID=A0AAV2M639_KNICA